MSTKAILKVIQRLEGKDSFTDEEQEKDFCESLKRDHRTYQKVREAIKILTDTINSYGNDRIIRAAFVSEITKTHRYLQQELLTTLLSSFGDLASLAEENEHRWTDYRNAHIYDVFKKMKAKLNSDFHFDAPR